MNETHILIVDDEEDIRVFLAYNLEREGFEVSTVANGQECLDFIAKQKPQLILLDVMMPVLDEYHLLNISIRADLQGQGMGRQLLQWGIGRGRSAGMQGMLLEVRPSNDSARKLYESEGFKLVGTRKNYYPSKQGREDALVLFKRFQHML